MSACVGVRLSRLFSAPSIFNIFLFLLRWIGCSTPAKEGDVRDVSDGGGVRKGSDTDGCGGRHDRVKKVRPRQNSPRLLFPHDTHPSSAPPPFIQRHPGGWPFAGPRVHGDASLLSASRAPPWAGIWKQGRIAAGVDVAAMGRGRNWVRLQRARRGSGVAPRRPGHREGRRGTDVPVGAGRTAIRHGTVVPGAAGGAICECGIQNSGTFCSPRTRVVLQQQGGVRIGMGQWHRRPKGGGGRFVPR